MKQLILIFLLMAAPALAGEGRRDFLIYYDVPNWPLVGTYGQEFHDSTNAAQRLCIAQRYEFGMGQTTIAADSVRVITPGFGWFKYNSFQDNYVAVQGLDEHNWMCSVLVANGYDAERAYLHYWDDTQVSLQGSTVDIDGWGGGSYTDSTASRVPVYYSNLSRRMCNYSDSVSRVYYIKYMVHILTTHPVGWGYTSTGYHSGIFWDNCGPELYNIGTVISGGHIREHPTHARIDSLNSYYLDWWYDSCIAPFQQELMETLAVSTDWMPDGSHIDNMLNTCNTQSRMATDGIATHLFWEFAPSIMRSRAGQFAGMEVFDTLCAHNSVNVCYSPNNPTNISGYSGSYPRLEVIHSNTCWFYVSCSDSTLLYHQGTNGPSTFLWDTLHWCASMDQDIGDPTARFDTIQSGTDGKGYSYNVLSRDYDSALVLLRPRGSWDQDIDETTAVSVTLGGTYYELSNNGSIGSAVTSVNIRNAQGKIMMKSEGSAAQVRKKTGNIKVGGAKL